MFDLFSGDIWWVSWIYLIGFLEICGRCPGEIYRCHAVIWWVSWRYLMGVLEILDWCPGVIWRVSQGYLMYVREIF